MLHLPTASPVTASTSTGSCLSLHLSTRALPPSYQYLNWFLSVSLHLPTGALPPSYQYLNWFLSVSLHLPTGAHPLLLPVPQLVPVCHHTYPLEPFPLPTSTSIGSCLYRYTYPLEPIPSYCWYLNWFLSVLLHLPTGALPLLLPVPQLVPVCHHTYPLEPFPLPTSTSIGSCLYRYTYPLEPFPLPTSTSIGSCLYRYTYPLEPFPLPTSTSIGSCLYCYTYPLEPFPSYCQYLNWFLSVSLHLPTGALPPSYQYLNWFLSVLLHLPTGALPLLLPVPQLVPFCHYTYPLEPFPLPTSTSIGSCLYCYTYPLEPFPSYYRYLNWFLSVTTPIH